MIKYLRRFVPRGRFGRGIAVLVSGTAAAQALTVLASPLLTRLYTPADFGVLGVFASLIGLLGLAICLRYELAVPLAENEPDALNLVAAAILAATLVSALVGLILWYFGAELVALFNAAPLQPWLWLLPVSLLAYGGYTAFSHWALRRQNFRHLMRTRLSQSISQTVVQIGLGVVHAGPLGLLLGQACAQSAGVFSLAIAFVRHERHQLKMVRPRAILAAMVRFRHMVIFGASGALLNGGSRLLPALLIAAIYGVEVAGLFELVRRVLAAPMRLFGNAVGQVYLSEASRLVRENRRAMVDLFLRTTWRLLAVAGVVQVAIAVAGPTLFALAFGAAWTEAGVFARFLALMYLAQLVVSPTAQTLTVLGRQDLLLVWEVGRLGAVLLVFAGAAGLAWPPLFTVTMLSGAVTTSYLSLFLLTRRLLGAATPHAV